jgi:hypothetical protein
MPRAVNYEDVLAFRAPKWAKEVVDSMRGPGEDRSEVLRNIVLPVLLNRMTNEEEDE